MKKSCCFAFLLFFVVSLCGCEVSDSEHICETTHGFYSEYDLEKAVEQSYGKGFEEGYDYGVEIQREKDCEEFLRDGRSINDIVEKVYEKYGINPSEAFSIIDEYEDDPSNDDITWDLYQKAIDAVLYTASIFPFE
jgi:hypothetical protein